MTEQIGKRVSVAMATYNGEKYLAEQLDSIINQTVRPYEIVVCDDRSSDGTMNLLTEYAQKYDFIHVCLNEQNLGYKRNFERALTICSGDYVAFSDQDDVWMPNHLELLLQAIEGNVVSCGNCVFMDSEGNDIDMTLKYQESLDYIPKEGYKKLMSILLFRNPYQGASMMVDRSVLNIVLPMPEKVESHDTWIASVGCVCGGLAYVDTPILRYRRLLTSVTGMRTKRVPRLKRLLLSSIYRDRQYLAESLKQRTKGTISSEDLSFLNQFLKMCGRNGSLWGHLQNVFYNLTHYRTVYSCSLRRFL